MYKASVWVQVKSLASLDSDGKSSKRLLLETLASLIEAAEACLLSVWRKLRVCEVLFSSLLNGISQIAVTHGSQLLSVLLIRLKSLVLTTSAQDSTVKAVIVVQLNVISMLADFSVSLKKLEVVDMILPLFIKSLEEGNASTPSLLRLRLLDAVSRMARFVSNIYSKYLLPYQCCNPSTNTCKQAGKGGELIHDETTIIAGALQLTQKTAKDAMTLIYDTFAVDINAKLDRDLMKLILEKGHSRVPVYYDQPTNIIGLILVLLNLQTVVSLLGCARVPEIFCHYIVKDERVDIDGSREKYIPGKRPILKLKFFPSSDNNSYKGTPRARSKWDRDILQIDEYPLPKLAEEEDAVGIITMEDVIEELLQEEIFDETASNRLSFLMTKTASNRHYTKKVLSPYRIPFTGRVHILAR
ncbi:hypothetical protein GIB67_013905 [Kingdonia uniflora]|uniref:PI4-kinase N-terminal domain-containing protein n=1 Tax=Kingdonia uniflora TaxID=39325 RepID=A0A7J7LDJ2_9MAGN|nr:hypothetical protein GIB67_013905 [Kingdonia uniflora]